jgi:hypothetical protein
LIIRAAGDGLKDEDDDHAFQKLVGDVQRVRQELAETTDTADSAAADATAAAAAAAAASALAATKATAADITAALAAHTSATGTAVHGLGTMSTQNASAVAITGGTVKVPWINGFCVEINSLNLAGAAATVVFAADETDPSSVYNAATGEFTVPVTGYYLLTLGFSGQHTNSSGVDEQWSMQANFYKNGSVIDGSNFWAKDGGYLKNLEGDYAQISKTYIKQLTAADVIVVKAYTNIAAGTTPADGGFSATFLGT